MCHQLETSNTKALTMVGILWITVLFEVAGAISITTPGNSSRISLTPYGITAEHRTSLMFKVKACGPAQIFLSDSETNPTKTREFVYGTKINTKCEFKDHTITAIFTKFSYTCSNACDDFDHYWISWIDENSDGDQDWRMGRGSVLYNGSIGNFPQSGPHFNPSYIHISSSDQQAIWEFTTQEATTKPETTTQSPETTSTTGYIANHVTTEDTTEEISTTSAPSTATASTTSALSTATTSTTSAPSTATTSTTPAPSTATTSTTSAPSTATTSSVISTSTQADQTSTSGPANTFCYCSYNKTCDYSKNYTDQEIAQLIEDMIQELKVSVKDTNAYKRKLISAPDDRPSAQYMGSVGALVIGFVILGIVLMDLPRAAVFFRNDKKTENARKISKSRKKSHN